MWTACSSWNCREVAERRWYLVRFVPSPEPARAARRCADCHRQRAAPLARDDPRSWRGPYRRTARPCSLVRQPGLSIALDSLPAIACIGQCAHLVVVEAAVAIGHGHPELLETDARRRLGHRATAFHGVEITFKAVQRSNLRLAAS